MLTFSLAQMDALEFERRGTEAGCRALRNTVTLLFSKNYTKSLVVFEKYAVQPGNPT